MSIANASALSSQEEGASFMRSPLGEQDASSSNGAVAQNTLRYFLATLY